MEGTAFSTEPSIHVFDDYNAIFNYKIAIPFWYNTFVLVFLSTLGILGVFFNGFVIWCFMFYPIVSYKYWIANFYV